MNWENKAAKMAGRHRRIRGKISLPAGAYTPLGTVPALLGRKGSDSAQVSNSSGDY
jgi:hypothetical protein